jgi:hypothetical protein
LSNNEEIPRALHPRALALHLAVGSMQIKGPKERGRKKGKERDDRNWSKRVMAGMSE